VVIPEDDTEPASLVSVGPIRDNQTPLVGYGPTLGDSRADPMLSGTDVRAIVGLPEVLTEGDPYRNLGVISGTYSALTFGLNALDLEITDDGGVVWTNSHVGAMVAFSPLWTYSG